ncbi:MAG: ABC-F family ATP-binding cassette domain-containing protein, partial [Pyrinomonadaceae bacterium]|nr:ABC-F family ATP-binding cassette domain-containing protein [Pyrinomonadaceae bacterium]
MLFKLSEIHKTYSGNEILKGVSFQVNPYEKVGLVGRNGAGKTTLFRIVTGEESADSGDLSKAKGLKIGLLEQHVDFTENETVHTAALTAFKKLHDIEARMRQLEIAMAEDSSDEILEEYADLQTAFEQQGGFEYTARAEAILLGLKFSKEDWNLETDKLSGGQKNRLGMVRLLLSEADLLLLDEPTNHLDVQTVEWLEEYLTNYDQAYV